MPPRADSALVAGDPGVPGLALLLDGDRLAEWLSHRLGEELRARPRYLRYKPGTSAVMAVDVRPADRGTSAPACASPPSTVLLRAYAPAGAAKLVKSLEQAPGAALIAVDRALLTLATTTAADRDLPALALLADPRRRPALLGRVLGTDGADREASAPAGEPALRTLAYKPHRRWVGALSTGDDEVVLRAYRPADLLRATDPVRALAAGDPATPRLLGRHRRSGLAALEFVPGEPVGADAPGATLGAVGAALGAFHAHRLVLPQRGPRGEAAAVARAVRDVARLLPEQADRADRLAARVLDRLGRLPATPSVTVHGDFSLDQVVLLRSGEVGILDLDRVGTGPAEIDLASLLAEALLRPGAPGDADALLEGVLAGYGPSPVDRSAVSTHLAAQLLRRAAEPFRTRQAAWADAVGRVLDHAERALRASAPAGAPA
ncbi:aminoglycoside phosphotransferase family protein [Georgenia wangjunii]|uniref:aminoglycoside phosphotransferase family protein n=1 Tax=Georgenia wangjunii TaxID=3117730 RepID=UPI002F26088C